MVGTKKALSYAVRNVTVTRRNTLLKERLVGVIIDRFGHDVWLILQGEDHFKTRVLVSVSPQFFGWVTGIESGMRITGPDNVKADYAQYLKNIIANYEVEDMVACRET